MGRRERGRERGMRENTNECTYTSTNTFIEPSLTLHHFYKKKSTASYNSNTRQILGAASNGYTNSQSS